MSEKLLRLDHITMQFGGVVAVDDLELEVNEGEIRQLFISHDALSEEQHHHHDDDGEHHHPEAGAQEGDLEAADVGLGIQKPQPPLTGRHIQECRDAAAGDRADTADDHDQQDLVGHSRGEHLGLRLIGEHGEQAAAHASEEGADAEGHPLVLGQVDAHGLGGSVHRDHGVVDQLHLWPGLQGHPGG